MGYNNEVKIIHIKGIVHRENTSRSKEDFKDYHTVEYTCEKCKKTNRIYWADPTSAVEKAKSVLENLAREE